ncbi:MAG TPA: hypothetical protein VH477_15295 [Bryobacteraceae bacterium]|jgi:hypothetical protein
MKADRVEVSWDNQKNKWLARIIVGEEVIRRYCNDAKNVDPENLRAAALKTATEEGYQVDLADVSIKPAG